MESHYDFVVVGSGVAGLSFALKAAAHGQVAIVTKRAAADSNTFWAQGGVACVTSVEDSFELHIRDTLEAGAGLCDEAVVRTVVTEGPARIRELIALGVRFDEREVPGGVGGVTELDLGKEGGHSKRRVLHSHDTTGREIEETLLRAVAANPAITMFQNHLAIDVLTSAKLGAATENRALGLYVLDESNGQVHALGTRRLVLASGGCGRVYQYTTNPTVATGDGVAIAWRAGATIANMEFVQFHPTCFYHPQARGLLITEAIRGEGGVLVDARGHSFMEKYHPLASLAPRDVVARAIDAEMKRTGEKCVYLDISHRPADFVRARFPHVVKTCLEYGVDVTTQPIPVVPAAHYQCGGVKTDLDGATSIRGLYAVGEVACTGLHGANRLASNSLLEGLVLAHRACARALRSEPPSPGDPARAAAEAAEGQEAALALPPWRPGSAADVDELVVIYHNWDEVRRLMWDYVGIVRTDKRLKRAAARLRNLQAEIHEYYWGYKVTSEILELRNLATVASLIVDSALSRKESRGLHYTLDYPETDDRRWHHDTLLRRY